MAGQQYDPEVVAFLKLRNAPLTHANYNSVLQQMQSNPSMRGAPVAEPSYSDKSYDGGLDELDLGGDVPKAGPRPGAKPPVPQSKPEVPGDQAQHGASGSYADSEATPSLAEAEGSMYPGGMGGAAAGGGGLLALLAALRSNGAGGDVQRVEPSGPAMGDPSVRGGLPDVAGAGANGASGAADGSAQDLLAAHAPPASLPAPAGFVGQDPRLSGEIQKLLPLMGDSGDTNKQLAITDQGAGGPMVNPTAAPRSSVVPMPDNAPQGMVEQLANQINRLGEAGRRGEAAQMIERLITLVGHAHR